MLRNYFAAAVRNLMRSRLHAVLNIVGLGVGLAAALLIALFVRHETSYDRFLPGYENLYRLSSGLAVPGRELVVPDDTKGPIVDELRLAFPQIEKISQVTRYTGSNSLRRGDVETRERSFFWAEPNIFEVLQLPSIAGDLHTALQSPDGLVVTRRMARRYFGTDNPIGQTIEVNRQYTMRVTAVLEDLPPNTHLATEMFASMRALPRLAPGEVYRCFIYLRASPQAVKQVRDGMEEFQKRNAYVTGKVSEGRLLILTPVSEIHLHRGGRLMKPPGDPKLLQALSLIGVLILLVAAINYINLMTARASRRAVEVGIRKVAGAGRFDLTLQFIGESLIYCFIAMLLACMLAELALPTLNSFLDREISFQWSVPLVASLLGATVVIGVIAGVYPALVLSSFKPASVLKGGVVPVAGAGTLRQLFVLLQFGILIGLIIAATVIHRQTAFGLEAGLRFDRDQMLAIVMPLNTENCVRSALADGVRALPGVRGVACSGNVLGNYGSRVYRAPDGSEITLGNTAVGPGFFELLGLKPLAGRFLSASDADVTPGDPMGRRFDRTYPMVVNETAARQLGYADLKAALGKVLVSLTEVNPGTRHEIVGVVQDFAKDSVRKVIEPAFFSTGNGGYELDVKLSGRDAPQTLAAIDRLWRQTAPTDGPISRRFFDEVVEDMYRDLTRQGILFTVSASLAVLLAVLGLFGLAAFTVERRTQEIGVRKALGASTSDVARLLLWRFVKPVLAANLIAWPLLGWVMSRWLQSFAYRIDLPLWSFPLAAAAALVIAVATVGGHSMKVARAVPVKALRYE